MNPDTLKKLVEIIVEVTGNDPETIKSESSLEDDLGVVLDDDFRRLILAVNQAFQIELDPEEANEVVRTVGDLAGLIDEELELG